MEQPEWIYDATLKELKKDYQKMTLTIDDMAKVFSTSKGSIYNQLRKKSKSQFPVKPRRAGRLLRWNVCDVARFLSGE